MSEKFELTEEKLELTDELLKIYPALKNTLFKCLTWQFNLTLDEKEVFINNLFHNLKKVVKASASEEDEVLRKSIDDFINSNRMVISSYQRIVKANSDSYELKIDSSYFCCKVCGSICYSYQKLRDHIKDKHILNICPFSELKQKNTYCQPNSYCKKINQECNFRKNYKECPIFKMALENEKLKKNQEQLQEASSQ